jgi:hypothetical protein
MPALDRYDPDVLDEEEYDDISQAERAAAEAAMRRRDREEGILTRRGDMELFYGMNYIMLLQTQIIGVYFCCLYVWFALLIEQDKRQN